MTERDVSVISQTTVFARYSLWALETGVEEKMLFMK